MKYLWLVVLPFLLVGCEDDYALSTIKTMGYDVGEVTTYCRLTGTYLSEFVASKTVRNYFKKWQEGDEEYNIDQVKRSKANNEKENARASGNASGIATGLAVGMCLSN